MGIPNDRPGLADTKEFLAVWSAAKEDHLAQELAPMLEVLLGNPENLDQLRVQEAAHHLVRAMYLAATPEGGIHAALDYLTELTVGKRAPSTS